MAPYYTDYKYLSKSIETGYVPLEAFVYINNENMLQNKNGIPISYHNYRRGNDKKINCNAQQLDMRYSTSIQAKI